jgi:hypothetical protein
MKTIIMSILTIVALSSAAFASANRNYELRDSPTYCGQYTSNSEGHCFNNTDNTRPFRIENSEPNKRRSGRPLTNYERLIEISNENDHGRH